jgi:hypothetical protein
MRQPRKAFRPLRRRIGRAAACIAAGLLIAGCGSGGSSVPRGNPDARHGAAAVDSYASVELLRALLVASSDGYYAGGSADDARRQLQRARVAYAPLSPRIAAADPVLQREVTARFDVLARDLRRGIQPDRYRDLANPLTDQLMDGVSQTLVKPDARSDPGLRAEALRRVSSRLAATYDAATTGAGDTTGRLAFQEAWGLWRRALALTALVKPDLGSQKDTVAGTLNGLRGSAFPEGPTQPDAPAAGKVDKAGIRVLDALTKRFGFDELAQ